MVINYFVLSTWFARKPCGHRVAQTNKTNHAVPMPAVAPRRQKSPDHVLFALHLFQQIEQLPVLLQNFVVAGEIFEFFQVGGNEEREQRADSLQPEHFDLEAGVVLNQGGVHQTPAELVYGVEVGQVEALVGL